MTTRKKLARTWLSSIGRKPAKRSGDAGFSLVELLVVLVIIGLLAGLVAPRVLGYLGGAKRDSALAQIRNIESALELFYLDNGRYPSVEQGLAALSTRPSDLVNWNGPYLKGADKLLDPWGKAYSYNLVDGGASYAVRSFGRDGAEGGDGEDRDLP